eukprot:TRINITY_DN30447_c0_g1_i1.p1 TRINITY_DN30447_c0_g1~~TRINITY_DN30447_c0_g1_i1.p1  ORF type:complete len:1532 (+),score=419.17 TRINITY_DN30447_c0_g1_i1:80-4675(+)
MASKAPHSASSDDDVVDCSSDGGDRGTPDSTLRAASAERAGSKATAPARPDVPPKLPPSIQSVLPQEDAEKPPASPQARGSQLSSYFLSEDAGSSADEAVAHEDDTQQKPPSSSDEDTPRRPEGQDKGARSTANSKEASAAASKAGDGGKKSQPPGTPKPQQSAKAKAAAPAVAAKKAAAKKATTGLQVAAKAVGGLRKNTLQVAQTTADKKPSTPRRVSDTAAAKAQGTSQPVLKTRFKESVHVLGSSSCSTKSDPAAADKAAAAKTSDVSQGVGALLEEEVSDADHQEPEPDDDSKAPKASVRRVASRGFARSPCPLVARRGATQHDEATRSPAAMKMLETLSRAVRAAASAKPDEELELGFFLCGAVDDSEDVTPDAFKKVLRNWEITAEELPDTLVDQVFLIIDDDESGTISMVQVAAAVSEGYSISLAAEAEPPAADEKRPSTMEVIAEAQQEDKEKVVSSESSSDSEKESSKPKRDKWAEAIKAKSLAARHRRLKEAKKVIINKMKAAAYTEHGSNLDASFFKRLDKDGTGTLTADEWLRALRAQLRLSPTDLSDKDAVSLFKAADKGHDGSLAIKELANYILDDGSGTKRLSAENVPKTFERTVIEERMNKHGVPGKIWVKCSHDCESTSAEGCYVHSEWHSVEDSANTTNAHYWLQTDGQHWIFSGDGHEGVPGILEDMSETLRLGHRPTEAAATETPERNMYLVCPEIRAMLVKYMQMRKDRLTPLIDVVAELFRGVINRGVFVFERFELTYMIRAVCGVKEADISDARIKQLFKALDYTHIGAVEMEDFAKWVTWTWEEGEAPPRQIPVELHAAQSVFREALKWEDAPEAEGGPRRAKWQTRMLAKLRAAFLQFDSKHNGQVEFFAFLWATRRVLKIRAQDISDVDAETVFNFIDERGEGTVSFAEMMFFVDPLLHKLQDQSQEQKSKKAAAELSDAMTTGPETDCESRGEESPHCSSGGGGVELGIKDEVLSQYKPSILAVFRSLLLLREPSLACAWRRLLDPGKNFSLSQRDFADACEKYQLFPKDCKATLKGVWDEMDADGSGSVTLAELDWDTANVLGAFHTRVMTRFECMKHFLRAVCLHYKGSKLRREEFMAKVMELRLAGRKEAGQLFRMLVQDPHDSRPYVTNLEFRWLEDVIESLGLPEVPRVLPGECETSIVPIDDGALSLPDTSLDLLDGYEGQEEHHGLRLYRRYFKRKDDKKAQEEERKKMEDAQVKRMPEKEHQKAFSRLYDKEKKLREEKMASLEDKYYKHLNFVPEARSRSRPLTPRGGENVQEIEDVGERLFAVSKRPQQFRAKFEPEPSPPQRSASAKQVRATSARLHAKHRQYEERKKEKLELSIQREKEEMQSHVEKLHNPGKFNARAFDRNYEIHELRNERLRKVRELAAVYREQESHEISRSRSATLVGQITFKTPLVDGNTRLFLSAEQTRRANQMKRDNCKVAEKTYFAGRSVHAKGTYNPAVFDRLYQRPPSPSREVQDHDSADEDGYEVEDTGHFSLRRMTTNMTVSSTASHLAA